MRELRVEPSRTKLAAVRVTELFGRLKLNGSILRPSPLSKVVELEMLVVGVRGKAALWTALQRAEVSLVGLDLSALVESAREQGDTLDVLRLGAVADAFGVLAETRALGRCV